MGMGDDVMMDGSDFNSVFSDDDSLGSPDAKSDTISLISNDNSTKSKGSKKRVQFLPDGYLVRIREIPPRSNKSSSDSDGSASDTSDSDSDTESATDSEDVSSERDTPSPAPTQSQNKFATMPPLLYAAKGSYNISKLNNVKSSNAVAKITGINPSTLPSSSLHKKCPPAKRARRSPSPKLERRSKRNNNAKSDKSNSKKNNSNSNSKNNEQTKNVKKRMPLKIKEGRISPPPFARLSKSAPSVPKPNNSIKLSQRRGSGSIASETRTLPVKKIPSNSAVTTSLTILPSSAPSPESTLDRVSRAMQSLTMGKLYTVDGFIFPPHHAKSVHLPDLSTSSNFEGLDHSILTHKRSSFDMGSPRRSLQEGSSGHLNNQTSPQSANRKRRHYAWQMANGSIQNALSSTPSISQLWDSPGRSPSDATDKVVSSNSR